MPKERKKILIIEDKKTTSRLLTAYLVGEGFLVFEVKNEESSLRIAFERQPDLILFDFYKPKIESLFLLKKLRISNWGKNVPVIILANSNDVKIVAEAIENNARAFLVKTDWGLEGIVKKIQERFQENGL